MVYNPFSMFCVDNNNMLIDISSNSNLALIVMTFSVKMISFSLPPVNQRLR